MAYVQPGVTVKQVQTNASPILAPPSLNACIVGEGFSVVETTDEISVYTDATFSGIQKYDNTLGATVYLNVATDTVMEEASVYVDILGIDGSWSHVSEDSFTADNGTNSVAISGLLSTNLDQGTIRVGYRSAHNALNSYFTVENSDEVLSKVGKATTYNPLAFGLLQALQNANSVVSGYGVTEDTTAGHTSAREDLALQEVYAMAPMTHELVESSYISHCNSMSTPENKKERIVFLNPKWNWYESDGTTLLSPNSPTTANFDKAGTATARAVSAFAVQQKRGFYINPDTVYVKEDRPIATVKQSYLDLANADTSVYGLYAKFTGSWTYRPGTTSEVKYYAGDDITDTAWGYLMDNTYGYALQSIEVNIPAPGYYLAAAVAGQVSGEAPEQGFTNLAVAGSFSYLKYSGDFFSASQLNTIAGGGNYVMFQANQGAPIVTRHQISTDSSSVEKRELSITKSLDFASKFIRAGLDPYIGKYNVTPAFLSMVRSILIGQGTFLRREGHIIDLKADKVEQDAVSKDTILVTLSISVKYPVNYIKVTLQF